MRAAQGCKIIAKDLEKSLAGLPMFIAHQQDEVELYKVSYKCLFHILTRGRNVGLDSAVLSCKLNA